MNRTKSRINLEARTKAFGLITLKILREVPMGVEFRSIRRRLAHSATAIGALYCVANLAETHLDYVEKIVAARKEVAQSVYWLSLIKSLQPDLLGVEAVHQEAMGLMEMFDRLRHTAAKGEKE